MSDQAKIILRRQGESWRQPQVNAYDDESALQALVVESPDLIPGVGPAAAVDEMYLPNS